jgi:hypothetical protein
MINTEISEHELVYIYFPSEKELDRFIDQRINCIKPIDVKKDYEIFTLQSERKKIKGLLEQGGVVAKFSVNVQELNNLTVNLFDFGAHVTDSGAVI